MNLLLTTTHAHRDYTLLLEKNNLVLQAYVDGKHEKNISWFLRCHKGAHDRLSTIIESQSKAFPTLHCKLSFKGSVTQMKL